MHSTLIFPIFYRKSVKESHDEISLQQCLLKRGSNTGVFARIFRTFWEQLFPKISGKCCYYICECLLGYNKT